MENSSQAKFYLKSIYDFYRTTLFNRKYYAYQLEKYKNWNLIIDLAVGLGTSSGIAGWYLWSAPLGKTVWAIIAGVASIASVLKPVLNFPKSIERCSKLFAAYSALHFDMEAMVNEIQATKTLSIDLIKKHEAAQNAMKQLLSDDDPKPSQKLLYRLYEEVNMEIPSKNLWIPLLERR